MGGEEVGHLLRGAGLGIGVAGGAQRRDKQLAGDAIAGGGVGVVRLEAGVIDKQPVAALVDLAHRQATRLFHDS